MDDDRKIQQLTNRRVSLLSSLGRADQFVREFIADRDSSQVQFRMENLDTVWKGLERVQTQLEIEETNDEGMTANTQIRANFESQYFRIKAALQANLPPIPSTSSNTIPNSAISGLSGIKLPTISLPEFDGDFNQWLTSHDTFVALIHSNQEVPDIQKFHYLRAAMKGEAAHVIESIAISSANYAIARQALKCRYANKYLLKKRHLQALLSCPRMKKESAAALHNVVDEYERHTKILRQLDEPIESWGTMLEHLLCLRLDEGTLKSWEDYATTIDKPEFENLINFLQRRIRVLESMSVNHQTLNPLHSQNQNTIVRKFPFTKITTHTATENPQRKCHACYQQHPLLKCTRFERMSNEDRLRLVNNSRLCHNCFRQDHVARNCSSNYTCRHCKRRHHTMLHSSFPVNESPIHPIESRQNYTFPQRSSNMINNRDIVYANRSAVTSNHATVDSNHSAPLSNTNVLLSTLVLLIVDFNGKEHPARAMLDSGSQSNIMSERLCQLLKLRRNKTSLPIYGIGESHSTVQHSVHTRIRSRKSSFELDLSFLVMPRITINLPVVTFPVEDWNLPSDLFLADPSFNETGTIDILLGAEHFFTFVDPGMKIDRANKPSLINSVFGWIISGRIDQSREPNFTTCHAILTDPLQKALENFWQIEEISNRPRYSIVEQQCEDHYVANVSRTPEGRYMVRLPRHQNFNLMLGDSKQIALYRFELLERRFSKNAELKQQYHEFMREYFSLSHMKQIFPSETENNLPFYLPHHPVFKTTSDTTKIRVVFDGSSKTSMGYSLNDALQVGPSIQDELLTLLIRFRKYPVALVADIEKMYRQILVHPADTHLQRILWRFTPNEPVSAYELQTVTYGLAPSSFLATRTLQQLADDEENAYPLGCSALLKGFYMDDLITGAESTDETIQTRKNLIVYYQKEDSI